MVLALALLLAFGWRTSAPVEALATDAPAEVFSAGRALDWLREGGPLEPRPGGSAAHARFRERLVDDLRELGLEVEVHEALGRGPGGRVGLVRNVVARQFAGAGSSSVLLSAHYDSVGSSPGAADDAVGCASLLEIARALTQGAPLEREVVYLFSDAEEAGLIGAETFAAKHPWAARVGAVVNLEARGLGGPSVVFQIGGGEPSVATLARVSAPVRASSLAEFVYKLMPNDTDYSVFASRKVSGFNLAFLDGLWAYHTPGDALEALDARSVQHQGALALELVRELARSEPVTWDERAVVFTDVFGRVVHWPQWAALVLGAAALALAHRRARSAHSSVLRAIAAAGPGVGSAALAAVLVVWGAFELLARALASPDAGARAPGAAHAAIALGCAGVFCALATFVQRDAGFRVRWNALGAAVALAALLAGAAAPELSFLALAPAVGWCVLEFALRPVERGRALAAIALLLALSLALWLPVRAQFALAISLRMPVVHAATSVCVLALAWPALALVSRAALARTALILGLAAAACFITLALSKPSRGAGVEWLNLRHVTDLDRNAARFEASTFGSNLPHSLQRAAEWSPATTPPFPWLSLDRSMHVADAPVFPAAAPALEILSVESTPGGRRVRARMRSQRGAPRLHLHLPAEVSLEAIAWRGQRLAGGFEGVRTQLLFAFEADGVELELLDTAAQPSSVHVLDQDWACTDEHRRLSAARPPDTHLPRSDGDVVIVGATRRLE